MSTQDTSAEDYAARLARIEAALALTPRSRCDDWDSDTVEWLLAQLRKRDRQLTEAREVLAPFLEEQPEYTGGMMGDGGYQCRACGREALHAENVRHATNCPTRRKDALLGRQASDEARA